MSSLVWPLDGNIKIRRLLRSELGQLDIELSEVGTSNFFVELLGQHVDTKRELFWGCVQSNLCQHLVGERARHNKRGVTGSTTEISLLVSMRALGRDKLTPG